VGAQEVAPSAFAVARRRAEAIAEVEHDVPVRVELEAFDLDARAKDALAILGDLVEISRVGIIDLWDLHPAIVRLGRKLRCRCDAPVHRLVMRL
jgi:hypothetical protein